MSKQLRAMAEQAKLAPDADLAARTGASNATQSNAMMESRRTAAALQPRRDAQVQAEHQVRREARLEGEKVGPNIDFDQYPRVSAATAVDDVLIRQGNQIVKIKASLLATGLGGNGISGTFDAAGAKVLTIVNGIITAISP